MPQSKLMSLAETLTQQITGQIIALVVLEWFYKTTLFENLKVSLLLLIASLIRSYIVRRLFNK